MATPELVIANASYKKYPGGVIVLRAADWMAGARGTLSSESDARSACGTVVRDSQKVTTSIFSNLNGAFQEAKNTFEIDFSLLPLEIDLTYQVFVSLLIEGDWDPTNGDTLRGGLQESFAYACALRWYGDSTFYLSDTDTNSLVLQPRGLDSYRIVGHGGSASIGDVVGDEVLFWRAYSQSGTTIEWLIDQIYFVPNVFSGVKAGKWRPGDFEIVPGQQGTSSSLYFLNPADPGGDWIDGADSGDNNGKFTWHPVIFDEPTGFSGGDGGGDYQRKTNSSDAEYMARVVADGDFFFLENSENSFPGNEPSSSHCYGLHGPFYIPAQTWVSDGFSRTVGDNNFAGTDNHFQTQNWGNTPEGFGWRQDGAGGPVTSIGKRIGTAVWVDGSSGIIEVRANNNDSAGAGCFLRSYGGENGPNIQSASIKTDNSIISGAFRVTATAGWASGGGSADLRIYTEEPIAGGNYSAVYILYNPVSGDWSFYSASFNTLLAGPFSSSWWGIGGTGTKFKIETLRYITRVKVWDASGSEPGAWNYEGFRPLVNGTEKAYPYTNDLNWALEEADRDTFRISWSATGKEPERIIFFFDDAKVEYDPYGTNESAWANIERPEGVEVGKIEMPSGCQHLVYWGRRDWTEFVAGYGPYLDFSAKVWNDPSAAKLQRSEAVWWWFRSVHAGIIPLHWHHGNPTNKIVVRP